MSDSIIDDLDESRDYFRTGGWSEAGGNIQSILFIHTALRALSTSPLNEIFDRLSLWTQDRENHRVEALRSTIIDYGCGEGDGTAFMQTVFPGCRIKGVDLNDEAIARAKVRWPTMDFEVGDLYEPYFASLIFSLHTLEHTPDPPAAIRTLIDHCQFLIVVVPPVTAGNTGGHKDAILFEEWRPKVEPLWETQYDTLRALYNEDKVRLLVEGNYLMIFKGNYAEELCPTDS